MAILKLFMQTLDDIQIQRFFNKFTLYDCDPNYEENDDLVFEDIVSSHFYNIYKFKMYKYCNKNKSNNLIQKRD